MVGHQYVLYNENANDIMPHKQKIYNYNGELSATMTNATAKSSFLATTKSYILYNTEVYNFCNQHFLQQKIFVAKNVEISDCKNGGLPCCIKCLILVLQENSILLLH